MTLAGNLHVVNFTVKSSFDSSQTWITSAKDVMIYRDFEIEFSLSRMQMISKQRERERAIERER